MLYFILRPFVRFIFKFFFKRLSINGLENIPKSGAIILASNHSNSFLDAAIIGCYLDRRMWSLGRGDVFKKKWAKKLLSSFFMLPVFRLSEGKEFMTGNDETFKDCLDLFKKGEIVLIFSEGFSNHQTKLLPLKKGTARLSQMAWLDGIDLAIVPIMISYEDFFKFGKNTNYNIGKPIKKSDFEDVREDSFFLKIFNNLLEQKLTSLQNRTFTDVSFIQNPVYYISSVLFFPAHSFASFLSRKITKGSAFFDSIVLGLLIVIYPIYWGLLAWLIWFLYNIS